MESIQPGSRGATRLTVHGSRSRDGAGPGATQITSQQWSFSVQPASNTPSFSFHPITTNAGTWTSAQLTPPTRPPSEAGRLSLYPSNNAEAGSSVDADILAAQSFLRQYHPDVDVPDHLLSNIIYDNAIILANTAHELDGTLGIADAQAIAVLGPVTFNEEKQKRIFAVVCVGGHNKDCLLLHQLRLETSSGDAAPPLDEKETDPAQAKGKAKATETTRLSFVPAHSAKKVYQSPILQIVASADRKLLAVRTHGSTSFLSLQHRYEADTTSRLHLEPVHEARYGTDGIAQHQDVCFSGTGSSFAATVDRHGRIDLYRFAHEDQQARGQHSAVDEIDPSLVSGDSPAPETRKRQGFRAVSAGSAAASRSAHQSVKTQRIVAALSRRTSEDAQDSAQRAGQSTAEPEDDVKGSNQAPFRILCGPDAHSLFLLCRHTLFHIPIPLESTAPESGAETASVARIILESSFCLSSFKRARFFSMAISEPDSKCQLLAVCSSDSIIWFDLNKPDQALFSTEHHRGDDPTLYLTDLPGYKDAVSLCILASRRNDLKSCYVVRAHQSEEPGYDCMRTDPATEDSSRQREYTLDIAPVLLPTLTQLVLGRDGPANLPLFINTAEILQRGHLSHSWIAFNIDQRGALLALLLQASSPSQHEEGSPQSRGGVEIDINQPPLDSYLYVDDSRISHLKPATIDSLSHVKTKILDYRSLHRTLFGSHSEDPAKSRSAERTTDSGHGEGNFVDLWSVPSKGHAAIQAATLSLKELFCRLDEANGVGAQGFPDPNGAPKTFWSNALDLRGDEEAKQGRIKSVLDLRADLRRSLSSLGTSSAQGRWSRTATVVSGQNARYTSVQTADQHLSSQPDDILERALRPSRNQSHEALACYLPTKYTAQSWTAKSRRTFQQSLKEASREMMLDLALEAELFVRPKVRILDEGAPTQRPQQRQGTNWTALEHRDIYRFVEEQGDTIPPPHIGSVGLSFFAPLRSGDIEAAATGSAQQQEGVSNNLDEAELEALLPSTSSTARLLLAEWQLGEDPADYSYMDPFQGLHRLPRASRLGGPTARERSRSFSRASSASTEDRSRSRSRGRKHSAVPSLSQSSMFGLHGPASSYPPSLVAHSQVTSVAASPAPPTLASRRKRQRNDVVSRSQPIRLPLQSYEPPHATTSRDSRRAPEASSSAAQSQPPKFGFAGSFGDLTPTVSPASSQVGTPTRSHFGAASTQIEAGRFGARPMKADRPPKKKKRASGF